MGKRRRARESALQGLYAWEIAQNPIEAVIEDLKANLNAEDEVQEFAVSLLRKSINNQEELDKRISGAATNWQFDRIALLDRLIMRMAICELMEYPEIPPKVTMNEAIDLAKKYSTFESSRFVNGVLDSVFRQLKEERKIHKRGRGLMETRIQSPHSNKSKNKDR